MINTHDLPHAQSLHLRRVTAWGLIRHGLSLHAATLWGALRASKAFREQNPSWVAMIGARFLREYGLNLILLVLAQALILPAQGARLVLLEVSAVMLLPLLSVAQVISDRVRGTCEVYTDPMGNVGLTVKVHQRRVDGTAASWAFLNHYALPVGKREGVRIRQDLHRMAQEAKIDLYCHAQNDQVAEYYMREHPGGVNLGGVRPLLKWSYRIDDTDLKSEEPKKKFDLFGFYSLRDSGQVPLRNR